MVEELNKVLHGNDEVEKMVNDGYAEKMIGHYFSYIDGEKESDFAPGFMKWCHENGWVASHAVALGVTPENHKDFINDYDFYRTWPHNSWMRMWINDKLTLKYLLHGTEFSDVMPKYYYYSTPTGLRKLVDNPYEDQSPETLLRIIREEGKIACKPNNGTESVGFHKLSFNKANMKYYMDSEAIIESDLIAFIISHPNHIYTEYIEPGYGTEKIHPKIHTLRLVIVNEDGNNPEIVGGYFRFPVDKLGEANYVRGSVNADDFMYYVTVDFNTGTLLKPVAIYENRVESMPIHPDTGFNFNQPGGVTIPYWDELIKIATGISKLLFGTRFIGFDFGVTNKGFKIMEINGLPGNMGDQWSRDVYDNSGYVKFMRKLILEIDSMTPEQRAKRRNIK